MERGLSPSLGGAPQSVALVPSQAQRHFSRRSLLSNARWQLARRVGSPGPEGHSRPEGHSLQATVRSEGHTAALQVVTYANLITGAGCGALCQASTTGCPMPAMCGLW